MVKKRILVVDAEPELVKGIQIRLKASNYEVLVAYDGMECLAKAGKEKPDLILLDILMPNMDGFQTLDKLKDNNQTKSIPVIMLTAKGEVEDVSRAAQTGAVDYIVKPVETIVMLGKIRKVLK